MESIEAGACAFHTHVRDAQGKHTLDLKLYHDVIDPIKQRLGRNVVVCGCPEGGATVAKGWRAVDSIIAYQYVYLLAIELLGAICWLCPITGGNSIWPYPIPFCHLSQPV